MKLTTITFAALQTLSCIVAAHPFVIVSTRVQDVLPTHIIHRRQDLFDSLASAVDDAFNFGDPPDSTTIVPPATRTVVTLPPPVTADDTTSSKKPAPTSSASDDDDDDDKNDSKETTSSSRSTRSTSRSATSTESSTSESTSTSVEPSTTAAAVPTAALGTASSTATSSANTSDADSDKDDNGVPEGGIAVAVVMILLIASITGFLVFRYHPRCQAWWAARQEKARHERSYRDGIDGVAGLSATPSLRQQALAGGGASKRRTMLQSFFAPATARLSANTEIRRKPVNWGSEPSTPRSPSVPAYYQTREVESEKVPMSASAAPMGQIERFSVVPAPPPKPTSVPETTPTVPVASPPTTTTPPGPSRAISRSSIKTTDSTPRLPLNQPVSPMTLRAKSVSGRVSLEYLTPVSPMSTYQRPQESISNTLSGATNTSADRALPFLPPVPVVPALIHAKRGSDGVFRLA